MAFQTNVLRNGEWVTETVNVAAALEASSSTTTKIQEEKFPDRGTCGLLSNTIAESPVVHKVLPVRLRSRKHNNIAFIGDYVVTISEISNDGQIHELLKYKSPGHRIRNAVVIGSCLESSLDEDYDGDAVDIAMKDEPSTDPSPSPAPKKRTPPSLPPQFLALFLESCEIVYLFVTELDGYPGLSVSGVRVHQPSPALGYYLAVDPSSRYLVAGSLENILVIYELKTWEELNEHFQKKYYFPDPFKCHYHRHLRATIQDVQFLYPRPQDDHHIILMIMVSSKSGSRDGHAKRRYIIWDWEVGEPLKPILGSAGHQQALTQPDGVPLFSIPLKSQNAFLVVYQRQIAIVKQPMSAAEYDANSALDAPSPSSLHHGAHAPLWTSWARPFRRKDYSEKTDIIYLTREDGLLYHIEIDSATLFYSGMEIGWLNTHIGTAFTTAYDKFSDLLIVGGESGMGGMWKLAARSELEQVSTFSTWSSVVDVAVTNEKQRQGTTGPANSRTSSSAITSRPDRIFLAAGRGSGGSLVEPRIGIKARIGIDMDIGEPIRQAWLFPDQRIGDGSLCAILSMPYSTHVLTFPRDFGDVRAETAESTQLDLESRTLHATITPSKMIIQVTETSITLVTASQSSRHKLEDILGKEGITAELACSADELIILSCQTNDVTKLCVLQIDQMGVTYRDGWDLPGEASCLTIISLSIGPVVLVGSVVESGPVLTIFSLQEGIITQHHIRQESRSSYEPAEAVDGLTSVCIAEQTEQNMVLVGGTRCGHLLMATVMPSRDPPISSKIEKIGPAPVNVFQRPRVGNEQTRSVYAVCDGVLTNLSQFCSRQLRFKQKDTVWPVDASDPSMVAPPISSVFSLQPDVTISKQKPLLLLLSGSRLCLADVDYHVSDVPRILPLGSTPTRVIYSNVWECLVVAHQTTWGINLALLDPDTGLPVSKSLTGDRTEGPLDGFTRKGDRILCLHEWLYVKDGQTFPFIVATTLSGRLLIVSVKVSSKPRDSGRPLPRLEHFTRYRKKGLEGPVYSVVSDDEGLVYCAGSTLHRDVLDLSKRKMKSVKELRLLSPAISLEIVDGKLLALTSSHSLEVIDYKDEMKFLHADSVARTAIHMTTLRPTDDKSLWPVTLISDTGGNIRGVWPPYGHPQKDLVTVLEATLYNSVRKFVFTNCRPRARREEQGQPRFGCLPSTEDGAEVLGVSLDGTLRHFRLLSMELWRYANLIQRLTKSMMMEDPSEAGHSSMYEDSLEPITDPKTMHVDGTLLERCMQQRLLEILVTKAGCLPLFRRCLDELEGGVHTEGFRQLESTESERASKYFALGYEVLEYLLSPLL